MTAALGVPRRVQAFQPVKMEVDGNLFSPLLHRVSEQERIQEMVRRITIAKTRIARLRIIQGTALLFSVCFAFWLVFVFPGDFAEPLQSVAALWSLLLLIVLVCVLALVLYLTQREIKKTREKVHVF